LIAVVMMSSRRLRSVMTTVPAPRSSIIPSAEHFGDTALVEPGPLDREVAEFLASVP